MAQLPSALACHLSSVASSEVPLACTAKSMIVVVPPHAAAVVPVAKVSAENVPPNGISMWVCASMPPGITYFPAASMTVSAVSNTPGAVTAAIVSPSTSTSAASAPPALTTVPLRMSVRIACLLLGAGQGVVAVRTAVAVELPQVPDLGQHAHVQVTHDDLVLGVRRRVAHQLPAWVGEVGLAVEVVLAQRLHADPVDRADEVLVRHRGGRLLEPPQVLRQPARGRRRVEHDPRAAQAQRAPALGEVPLVADVHADLADRSVEHRVAEVAGPEVELLPEALDLRDVVLAVLAEVGAVRVDHRGRVVVDARLLLLVHRHDQHHVVLVGQLAHQLRG